MGESTKKKVNPLKVKNDASLTAKEQALNKYDEELPNLISTNVKLQKKALTVIEEKIDNCNAVQAATIYGILHDKCTALVGNRQEQNTQFNMFIGDGFTSDAQNDLMEKVLKRMKSREEAEEEIVVVDV